MNEIVINIDIDWAHDRFIQYVIDGLDEFDIRATIFATHKSDLLLSLDKKRYELGIHPNFNDTLDHEKRIRELLSIYPDAQGIRAHSLFSSTKILKVAKEYGLRYEANTYLPYHESLHPVERFRGFYSFPCFWIDGEHIGERRAFTETVLKLTLSGLKIYIFHPIHVFANTPSDAFYLKVIKPHYHDHDWIMENVYRGRGMRYIFFTLLDYIGERKIETKLLRDLLKETLREG